MMSISGIITALWFIFMTWLSHQDGEHTRETSLKLAEGLSFFGLDKDILNGYLRKAAHIVVFFMLAVLLGFSLFTSGRSPYYAVLPCLVWAWGDEATKRFIKGRHFSWQDVGLNALGAGIGLALVIF